ncbi:DsbA family protein [Neoaquamicrobium sediminum]|uniref:DsbA family protein n=1 Tax=Neoaquamicrobium sediminum TaxID=1849104 RepID=UPI00403519F1
MTITRRTLLVAGVTCIAAGASSAQPVPRLSDILFDPMLPVLGNPDGDVTVAEFFDYACPTCKALHPHLKRAVAEDGGIRLVMKDWPINGGEVLYPARMVLAANTIGVYAQAHDAVMALKGRLTLRRIDDAMRDAGVDVGAVRDALDVHLPAIDALLERNHAQARALSLVGTPGFIVGSTLYRRPVAPDELRNLVAAIRRG